MEAEAALPRADEVMGPLRGLQITASCRGCGQGARLPSRGIFAQFSKEILKERALSLHGSCLL